ncbi:Tol-Pal system beta propeller repeat protein TolB [Porphyrobacter sp. AAP82]|uniref:Tol-Pal system beta propeller repeat protein TolB n=1 Tax=Porphyrobacter sp. AAP82 TaxID=1248917 RepID=UPI00031D2C7D|nr:Tol-Pal system beta propeller repeat protein TolB [Porphyrobacter sp. AAP82]
MKALIALLLAGTAVAPAAAQDLGAPQGAEAPVEVIDSSADEDVVIRITDEAAWSDIGIAIPAFATDRERATPANEAGTGALGREIARVITANLRNNGLFKPVGPDSLPQPAFSAMRAPAYGAWAGQGAEMLVQGYVTARDDGRLTVGCYLYDVELQQQLVKEGWVVAAADWRRAAHKCSDLIFARLTGESPFFDSRIAYIAETGPKDRRVKRLAVMDSDGANHRFLTLGSATALTPRYSPDYSKILYLSYVDGNPRIYVYDIGSGKQTLVTENRNPTIAPRWSPDGKSILFSMAVAGNTDIYRIAATGGTATKLTDTPGIDVGGSYSPDGTRIVFESDRSGSQQCYIMDADGTNQKRISFFGGRCATPEWSPRGDQIAFTRIAGDFNVAVMNTGGGGMRVLTKGWQDEAPTWAPNGRIIQFFRTEKNTGRSGIWQVDLTGQNERRLPTPVDASDPAWGPIRP